MQNQECFNPAQITRINFYQTRKDDDYIYQKERKIFGYVISKSGFRYKYFSKEILSQEYILSEHDRLIINNEVYIKPNITISFSDGSDIIRYFQTNEEATEYLNKLCEWCKPVKFIDNDEI